ncbi:MAG: hydrogenase maturation protease [Candidatus Sumerlaeaceae bacterium]
MKRILVIGYGNPLRGDDGVGWHVATQLFEHMGAERCDVRTLHQLVPELVDDLARSELAVLIDASADHSPGSVRIRELQCKALPKEGGTFSHHVGPGELLTLTATLYGRIPRTFLCTIGGEDFGYSERLSQTAQTAVQQAMALIVALLRCVEEGLCPDARS